MRLDEPEIRAALLHRDEEVRFTAVSWYSSSFSRDPSVMPAVIESARKYGPAASWRIVREAQWLVQTEGTLAELKAALEQRSSPADVREENFRFAAALVVCRAPIELIAGQFASLANLPSFPEVLRGPLEDRWRLMHATWEQAAAELVKIAERTFRYGRWNRIDCLRADAILEALARHAPQRGPAVLVLLLRRNCRRLLAWVQPFIIRLAGRMRFCSALPLLLDRLDCDNIDIRDEAELALAQIGTEEVVESIIERWPRASRRFRESACEVLERSPSERAVGFAMQRLSDAAEDGPVRLLMGHALLAQFCPGAIPLIRALLRKSEEEDYSCRLDLYYHLLAACPVMRASFPGFRARYRKAVKARWGWKSVPILADGYFEGPWAAVL